MAYDDIDAVQPERRSIRNIGMPSNRSADEPREPWRRPKQKPRRTRWLWLVAILVVLVGGLVMLLSAFAGATVTVTELSKTVSIGGIYVAVENSQSSSTLPYQVLTVQKSASTTLPAVGTQNVKTKASGQVIIYNAYNSSPQELVATTRLQTPSGLIYRIAAPVTVPGETTVNGQSVPGSVVVTAYADQPGPSYNMGLTTFTIPGFKNTPRYKGFYAKSKTAMTGGFSGPEVTADPAAEASAEATLTTSLASEASTAALAEVPVGFISLPGLSVEQAVSSTSPENSSINLTRTLTYNAVIVREADLASFIAQENIQGYQGAPVSISNPSSLSFALASSSVSFNPSTDTSFDFTMEGSPTLVWTFDVGALKSALAGTPKSNLDGILQNYPSIEAATAVIRPFWQSTFPTDPSKINVVISQ